MKCSGRRAQKSRHAVERLSNFREDPGDSGQVRNVVLLSVVADPELAPG